MTERRRSGSETRKRPHSATVRFSDAEWIEVLARADEVGLSIASYLRLVAIDAAPPRAARTPPIDRQLVAQLVGHVGKIGSNINQIARAFNAAGAVPERDDLAKAMAAVLEMRAACLQALGRKP